MGDRRRHHGLCRGDARQWHERDQTSTSPSARHVAPAPASCCRIAGRISAPTRSIESPRAAQAPCALMACVVTRHRPSWAIPIDGDGQAMFHARASRERPDYGMEIRRRSAPAVRVRAIGRRDPGRRASRAACRPNCAKPHAKGGHQVQAVSDWSRARGMLMASRSTTELRGAPTSRRQRGHQVLMLARPAARALVRCPRPHRLGWHRAGVPPPTRCASAGQPSRRRVPRSRGMTRCNGVRGRPAPAGIADDSDSGSSGSKPTWCVSSPEPKPMFGRHIHSRVGSDIADSKDGLDVI